jgi:putative transposase
MERDHALREIGTCPLPVVRSCRAMGIPRSTYYRWKRSRAGPHRPPGPSWNALSPEERRAVLQASEEHPEWPSRQIAFHLTDQGSFSVSESTVYRILKAAGKIPVRLEEPQRAADEYAEKPRHVHDQWQSDFTDFFLPAWGWYHDGGVLDDRSRFMLHHDLRPYEKAADAVEVFAGAVAFARRTHGYAARRIVTDHGKCFEAKNTKAYLYVQNIRPIHARSHHPQTVGKLERLHRTMKEHVNVHVYPNPWELQRAIDQFYRFYNYERYHESLSNVTPADVYFGRAEALLRRREAIKERTKEERRARYEAWKTQQAALTTGQNEGTLQVGLSVESASSEEAS